jgi:hypothetical protein
MNTTNRKRRHLVTAVSLALVLAAPFPSPAEASQLRFYDLPMVDAKALGETLAWEFDALISGQIEDLLPRTARANNGSAFAEGEASTNAFWATAVSGGSGAAVTRSYVQFVIRDPQARGLVKVNLRVPSCHPWQTRVSRAQSAWGRRRVALVSRMPWWPFALSLVVGPI